MEGGGFKLYNLLVYHIREMPVNAYNSGTQGVRAGRLWLQGQPEQHGKTLMGGKVGGDATPIWENTFGQTAYMYKCMNIERYMYTYIHMYLCICIHICDYINICASECMYVYLGLCVSVFQYRFVWFCLFLKWMSHVSLMYQADRKLVTLWPLPSKYWAYRCVPHF